MKKTMRNDSKLASFLARILVAALIVSLGFAGCSKEGASSSKKYRKYSKRGRLVPTTVAELEASPDFKLDHTTGSGTKIYLRFIDPKIDESITEDSPDWKFRGGGSKPYLLVFNFGGQVVSSDYLDQLLRTPDGAYTPEGEEIFVYVARRTMKDMATDWEKLKKEASE